MAAAVGDASLITNLSVGAAAFGIDVGNRASRNTADAIFNVV
jgi:hypothetical protein